MLKRRNFLKFVFVSSVLTHLSKSSLKALSEEEFLSENFILSFFRTERSVIAVGDNYLKKTSSEADANILKQIIQSQIKNDTNVFFNFLGLSSNKPEHLIVTLIREDFRTKRVINIDGFIMSKTELRLCALFFEYAKQKKMTNSTS